MRAVARPCAESNQYEVRTSASGAQRTHKAAGVNLRVETEHVFQRGDVIVGAVHCRVHQLRCLNAIERVSRRARTDLLGGPRNRPEAALARAPWVSESARMGESERAVVPSVSYGASEIATSVLRFA